MSVSAGTPANVNDPITAPFTVTNKSIIPLRHVAALVSVEDMNPNLLIAHDNLPGEWSGHALNMGGNFTIEPSEVFRFMNPKEAGVAVVVTYHPWILPLERKKIFHFSTRRDPNGNLYWSEPQTR